MADLGAILVGRPLGSNMLGQTAKPAVLRSNLAGRWLASPTNPTIRIPTGGQRTFRVLDRPGGSPVPNALVSIMDHFTQQQLGNLVGSFRRTDANGLITFRNLDRTNGAKYVILVTHPSHQGFNAARLDLLDALPIPQP